LGVPIDLVYLDLGGTVVELIEYEGAAVQAYLDQHPTGHFAALARARLSSPEVN
jgi:hypothetical protein